MSKKGITQYSDFYLYYLNEHSNPICRGLHLVGTGLALVLLMYSLGSGWWWGLLLVLPVGYGFAWVGHFFFEKNKPATFRYPLWSFASDFVMLWHAITGQLPAKRREAQAQRERLLAMA
ncbi:MAG: DUF962 domain-containing protein [Flavobacteriales bacterium]|nr:DUF962 domain-containing protein [Flavobacteriales bacterium]MCX7767556.1 DUF962 domain-containing protein [Flavobacteriales bacterium]MDW8410084.1 DUF962 domain-containing protein [Flavobacteriales bacterium]